MMRRPAVLLVSLLLFIVISGCQAGDPPSTETTAARSVTDPSGHTVTLPAEPSRVFGMYTTDLDYALTLGVGLAPKQSIRSGSVGFPGFFPQQPLRNLTPLINYPEPQYEKIAEIKPDLIINGLGYSGGPDVAKLAAIAPTFTYDGFDGDWRDDFTALAAALGKQRTAEEFLRQLATETERVRKKVSALERPPVIAYGWANEDGSGGFNGSAPTTLGTQVFDDIGVEAPSAVQEKWTEISHERIADLDDVDLIMIAVETDTDPKAVLARIRKDSIWSRLPAVRAGRLVAVNNELSYASPHAHQEFLRVTEKAIDDLASG